MNRRAFERRMRKASKAHRLPGAFELPTWLQWKLLLMKRRRQALEPIIQIRVINKVTPVLLDYRLA